MAMTDSRRPSRGAGGLLLRLLLYYALVAAALAGLVRWFPGFGEMLSLDFEGGPAPTVALREGLQAPRQLSPELGPLVNTALLGTLAMLGGLLFAVPVAWTYTGTKRVEGYDKSVVQMIVMLPLAVGGVVLLVRGQLALAFALAGIVAAVRFRTTFKDVKDAVFAFVAIGIGLASGMQAWLLAAVFSFVFCMVVLTLWRFQVGEARVGPVRAAGPVTLSEALTPGDSEPPILIGDAVLTAPLSDDERTRLQPQADRLERQVRADALRDKEKFKHLLLVYATDPVAAETRVQPLLETHAKRWHLVETAPARDGTRVLEYLVRFKKTAEVEQLLDELHGGASGIIRAIELKSMKGLRDLVA
jgi:hypothetical protein